MAKELKDIQQLINDKADSKLKKLVNELYNLLSNGENFYLIKDININIGTAEKPRVISLAYIFGSNGFEKQIIENNTERYRMMESAEFLSKVESIREDIDGLLNDSLNH